MLKLEQLSQEFQTIINRGREKGGLGALNPFEQQVYSTWFEYEELGHKIRYAENKLDFAIYALKGRSNGISGIQ